MPKIPAIVNIAQVCAQVKSAPKARSLAGHIGRPVEELPRDLVGEGVRSRARAAARDARGVAQADRDPLDGDPAVALVAEEVRQIRAT